ASGAVPIVNPSGGMQDDVYALNLNEQHPIHPGFTAITAEDYAGKIWELYNIWKNDNDQYRRIQKACYEEALRFSVEQFREELLRDFSATFTNI
ncbi:MAG: hypothetical protein EZS28_049179, partial [Streblomastix strix]